MTLPFRRRHNDAEASHDRARSLISTGFMEALVETEATWLDAHLAGCPECAADAAAYGADREVLRTFRDRTPEPPRDLWARTAAAMEQDGTRRGRSSRPVRPRRNWRIGPLPVGVVSGLVVILVVVGVSLAPRGGPLNPGGPTASDGALNTPNALATPIAVTADALAWIQVGTNGSFEFRRAIVTSVCPDVRTGCATLDTGSSVQLNLSQAPQSVVQSPTGAAIVVVTSAASTGGTDVVVVPVPAAPPTAAASPSTAVDPSTSPVVPSTEPSVAVPPSASAPGSMEPSPSVQPSGSPVPSGSPAPTLGHSIVSGVVVVGDTSYSPDGQWLAFSARPANGSSGPDLYLWHVGDELAKAITSDHRTFFAGWLGNQVLANVIVPAGTEAGQGSNAPSASPSALPSPTPRTPAMIGPNATPGPSGSVIEEHPIAFTLDPATQLRTVLAAQDMWRPTVDSTGRSVVYWAGTLIPDSTGTRWSLGTGSLVIDGWLSGKPAPSGIDVLPSSVPGADPASTARAPASSTPRASASSTPGATDATGHALAGPIVGPAGHPMTIAQGPLVAFDNWFDPSGLRLAVWIADPTDPAVGTLRLVVLDSTTLQIDRSADPLPGVAALRGVSMNEGRLAWVTPPGQDGAGSHVQVLGWQDHDFGQVRTIQAERLLVVR